MRVMFFILYCLIAFLPQISFASNDEKLDLSKLPMQQCSLEKVSSILFLKSLKRSAIISENSTSIVKELEKISTKATDHTKSVGAQLSLEDLENFNTASQRSQTIQMETFIEGDFQRDLMVIQRLVELSDNYYRWNKIPNKKDKDDFLLFSLLLEAKEIIPSKDLKVVKPSQMERCSLDYALFDLEREPLTKFTKMHDDVLTAMARVDQIYAKYKGKEKNYSSLNADDKNEISFLREKYILPTTRVFDFIRNIEIIRRYAKISSLAYKSSMSDLLYSGGDKNKVGLTMENKIKSGELGKADVFVSGMWIVINEKIPCDAFRLYKQILKPK